MLRSLIISFICTLALVFGVIPKAKADMFKPSITEQIKLGEQAAAQLRKENKILPATDPRVIEVRKVAAKIIATFPKKEPWHFTFDVIESKDVNAFALPGGPTFFYTGLLNKLTTEDELAGVIGHELTHVRHQHWARMYADETKRSLGIGILLTFVHVGDLGEGLANVANSLYSLQYSRGDEENADEGGFKAMTEAGYNPEGMIDLFKTLSKYGGSGGPEMLSDHPSNNDRISKLEAMIKKADKTFPPQTPLPKGVAIPEVDPKSSSLPSKSTGK